MSDVGSRKLNSWIRRGVGLLEGTRRDLVMGGSPDWGISYLLEVFRERNDKTIRIKLAAIQALREEFQASAFAHAVLAKFGWRVVPAAVSLKYQARLLAQRVPNIDEDCIVVEGADYGLELLEALQEMPRRPRLILEGSTPGLLRLKRAKQVNPAEFLLRREEAFEIAQARGEEALAVWEFRYNLSGGRYRLYVDNLPAGENVEVPEWEEPLEALAHDAEEVYRATMLMGDPMRAASLLVPSPEVASGFVEHTGAAFAEEGVLEYLRLHLDTLPEPYASSEGVLEWRLIGAVKSDADTLPEMITRVGAHLEQHEAPALRARYGGVIGGEDGLAEARRALASARAAGAHPRLASILFEVAKLTPDRFEAVSLLTEAANVAKDAGQDHEFVRSSHALAQRLASQGELTAAAAWVSWALERVEDRGMMNGARRRELIYDLALYRWMLGKSVGLRKLVHEEAEALGASVEGARFWLLLAAMASAREDVQAAEMKLEAVGKLEAVVNPAVAVMHRVQHLLHVKDGAGARQVAEAALTAAGKDPQLRARALVAMAAAVVARDAERAKKLLLEADELLGEGFSSLRLNLELYLARATSGELRVKYRHLFNEVSHASLRLLGGADKKFNDIYANLTGQRRERVVISALGKGSLVVDGESLHVTKQSMEALVVLALHPAGMTLEEFNAAWGEELTESNVRVIMSRVRKLVPVTRVPYQLELGYMLDVREVEEYLDAGNVMRALEMMHGRVLPMSDVPAIVELRERLEARLKEAVFASKDLEVIAAAREAMPYDEEVQKLAQEKLMGHDARRAHLDDGELTAA